MIFLNCTLAQLDCIYLCRANYNYIKPDITGCVHSVNIYISNPTVNLHVSLCKILSFASLPNTSMNSIQIN